MNRGQTLFMQNALYIYLAIILITLYAGRGWDAHAPRGIRIVWQAYGKAPSANRQFCCL